MTRSVDHTTPGFACPKHGPECDFSLELHPLPPRGYPSGGGRLEDEEDPNGRMADWAAAKEYGV